MIAAINPSKTLQKPLEAILKPSKGFSLSMAHQRARTQSRGSTLTACGRATLDGVKRHPHPRGCSSLELLPLAPPRIGNGAKPRIWVKGRVPCGVQGRSPDWVHWERCDLCRAKPSSSLQGQGTQSAKRLV